MHVRPCLSSSWRRIAIVLSTILATCTFTLVEASPASANFGDHTAVAVSGNQLVDFNGTPVRLIGVNRSGTEYACAQGWGIFDGPSDAASVASMASWGINAVRVPLNEDCWLGINGVNPSVSGAAYQSAIQQYVADLNAHGLVAILDLHWSAPGTELALGQQQMADAQHSPIFWSSVASAFRSVPGVIFDLYNEPHDISWNCWLHGCYVYDGWAAAGMQQLVDAVRSTGASQPIMVAGVNWANDLSQWLRYEPYDPDNQLIASVHVYDYSQCNTMACWDTTISPVAAQVPVVSGEVGETDCGTSFIGRYTGWADAHSISYLAWSWDSAGCSAGPSLINNYNGSPTAFGAAFLGHLHWLNGG